MIFIRNSLYSAAILSVLVISSCSNIKTEAKYPTGADRNISSDIYSKGEGIFGKDGLRLLGGKKDNSSASSIGVNAHLWRASLDTISFMPLSSADPFGGTILTDWYTTQDAPNERTKVNIFILDKQLRADGIKVKTFRQAYINGRWIDSPIANSTNVKLEDTILTRARQIRSENTFKR